MARLKLLIPLNIIFSTSIPIRITDLNYGNHVGNDAMVSIVHEARVQWLASAKYTELDVAGAALIIGDLSVEYKAESFYGDILSVNIYTGEIKNTSFEIYYEITTTRGDKNILIAKAKTGMICYDYKNKKVSVLPEEFIAFLNT